MESTKPAHRASPAPVWSTARTLKAGILALTPRWRATRPLPPSETTTRGTPTPARWARAPPASAEASIMASRRFMWSTSVYPYAASMWPHPPVGSKYNALQRAAYFSMPLLGVLVVLSGIAFTNEVGMGAFMLLALSIAILAIMVGQP